MYVCVYIYIYIHTYVHIHYYDTYYGSFRFLRSSSIVPASIQVLYVWFQSLQFGKTFPTAYLTSACVPQGTTYSLKIRPDSYSYYYYYYYYLVVVLLLLLLVVVVLLLLLLIAWHVPASQIFPRGYSTKNVSENACEKLREAAPRFIDCYDAKYCKPGCGFAGGIAISSNWQGNYLTLWLETSSSFCWLKQAYHRPHFIGICVINRGVQFHRIRDFKQYYFKSIPPTSHTLTRGEKTRRTAYQQWVETSELRW